MLYKLHLPWQSKLINLHDHRKLGAGLAIVHSVTWSSTTDSSSIS